MPKEWRLGQFADLRGTWQEGGGVFDGEDWYFNANYVGITDLEIWEFHKSTKI